MRPPYFSHLIALVMIIEFCPCLPACSCLGKDNNMMLYMVNMWLYSVVLKVVPCFVLTVFTGFLIRALYKAEERSARLKVSGSVLNSP